MITTKEIGKLVRAKRKKLGLTQAKLAMIAGTGLRFLTDLENGKDSCQQGKVLRVMQRLGIKIIIDPGLDKVSNS